LEKDIHRQIYLSDGQGLGMIPNCFQQTIKPVKWPNFSSTRNR